MLKACIRMFDLASIWITRESQEYNSERTNEARVNRY